MTRRRATSRASSTGSPSGCTATSASTSCRSGATTASAAAATIPSSSTPAYPAVRFSVAVENYNHQHQDLRVEKGVEYGDTIDKMDFPYLAQGDQAERRRPRLAGQRPAAARADGRGRGEHGYDGKLAASASAASTMSSAGDERTPANGQQSGRSGIDAMSRPAGICRHMPVMQRSTLGDCRVMLKGIRVDDWVFGVSSVSKDGFESPVASAVPGGAFKPWVKPAEAKK